MEKFGKMVCNFMVMFVTFPILALSAGFVASTFIDYSLLDILAWTMAVYVLHVLAARITARDIAEADESATLVHRVATFVIRLMAIWLMWPLGHLTLWIAS